MGDFSPEYKIEVFSVTIIKIFHQYQKTTKNLPITTKKLNTKYEVLPVKMDLLQMIMTSDSNEFTKPSINMESPRLIVRHGNRRVRDTVPAIITFDNTSRRLANAHLRWKSMSITAHF